MQAAFWGWFISRWLHIIARLLVYLIANRFVDKEQSDDEFVV